MKAEGCYIKANEMTFDAYVDGYMQGVENLVDTLCNDTRYKSKFEDISVDGHGLKWWIRKAAGLIE